MTTDAAQFSAAAMRHHREGRFAEAEELCRKALVADAQHHASIVHLAVLLRHRGEFQSSREMAGRAISLKPDSADGYIQLGLSYLGEGHPSEAAAALVKAISLSPKVAPLHYHLGLALENLGRTAEAKESFLEASRLAPQDVRARLSLGSLLLTEEDLAGAKFQADTAIKLDPSSAEAQLLKAKTLVAEGKAQLAEERMRAAISLDPNQSFGHTMLAFRLLQSGDFKGAEEAFQRSIELDPAQGVAYFGITQCRKLGESDRELLGRMEGVLHGVPLTHEQAGYLHFGIAKAYDNLGNYEQAMAHYDDAHRNAHLSRYGDSPFDERGCEGDLNATKSLYTNERFLEKGEQFDSNLPIFIVGMMRSGTTLTEQILSSHPEVGAAGEHLFWAKRGHLAEDFEQSRVNRKLAANLAREYCRELRNVAPGCKRVTDKLPGNYARLGLIHLAMPNAKIIHCRRSPIDTSLSIYFTANPTAPDFSHSKEGIVFAYRRYLEMMEHWRSVLPPGSVHEIQYEDLVAEPERVIRGMLDYLGLEWNEACLHHDQNAKEVRTPSLWQVRQPMYNTSVDRWRRYEPWLGAFSQLLPA